MMTKNEQIRETRSLLTTLILAGWYPADCNLGLDGDIDETEADRAPTAANLMATGQAVLTVYDDEGRRAKLLLVYGNNPGELVADYTAGRPTLEKAITHHANMWGN